MKNLNWIQKGLYLLNIITALALIFGLLIPYIPIELSPKLSIFSLAVPPLVVVNLLFMLFWLFSLKRQWLLSFLVLLAGYSSVLSLYKFGGTPSVITTSAVKVMTYNVRLFNKYEWIEQEDVAQRIQEMVKQEDPDILCMQEFHKEEEGSFSQYPFRYVKYKTGQTGQVIFSKFPIVGEGSLDFPDSGNNAIYADLSIGRDTVRVYNLHLQSFMINPEKEEISQENSNRIANRMGIAFSRQKIQADIFEAHRDTSPYPAITCGDLNNTQFSAIYRQVRGDAADTFEEQGKGTGKTYYFKYYPLRIDFIFTHESIPVISHKNRYDFYSDHYPVISQVRIH
ncbi:endonuclease/exonuclease/phosphatase family protein [Robertkochia flava]|uniref:endonuclease/exonuclease/phosphatase family protein n=1 Tax=Robertkochia flava TaxID=3447986 RepID=UPI001CCC850D|nr:endonuclease/exonuclease/phosphatase family protein [Robertkochia marina]